MNESMDPVMGFVKFIANQLDLFLSTNVEIVCLALFRLCSGFASDLEFTRV